MKTILLKCFIVILQLSQNYGNGIVMRNNALMSKMGSHFHEENALSQENLSSTQKPNVLSLMQNVLCRNFPSIPCGMIMKDNKLNKLIEKSIQQLKYKKIDMDPTSTSPDEHLTLFPVVNSEDLSKFLQISDTGYNKDVKKKHNTKSLVANFRSHEVTKKKKKKASKRTSVGRKKIRKFYPHKIKYMEKNNQSRRNYQDYSEEKLSMSVEMPELSRKKTFTHRSEPTDQHIWRIDYIKHGEPSFMIPYENDKLKGKIVHNDGIINENNPEQVFRKYVLQPDVYIKNNFVRKNVIETDEMDI